MNYGKSAYLKVIELEKKITSSESSSFSENGYLEFDKSNLSQVFSDISSYSANFPVINLKKDQEICFEIKATLNASASGSFSIGLNINNARIYSETKQVSAGFNDIIIFKTFTSIADGETSIALDFYSDTTGFSASINDIKLIILGIKNASANIDIEMHALKVSNNKVLISYIDSDRIYYNISDINAGFISNENFSPIGSAVSHCFATNTLNIPNNYDKSIIYLLRVDSNNNLYLSQCFENQTETLIDTSVSCVYATACPSSMNDSILIVYIKNGDIYFTSLRNGVLCASKKLQLSSSNFKSVIAVTKEDSGFIYIIATDKNNSNYIVKSVVAKELSNSLENISIDSNLVISKYVDLTVCDNLAQENISINTSFVVSIKPIYNSLIEQQSVDHINLSASAICENYQIPSVSSIIYGIKFDTTRDENNNPILGTLWGTYTDDAAAFDGAYMDFANDIFVDNGWFNRWPFNEIKPCIVKNGVVVGYLNKNDYTKFEDGTAAPNNDRTAGNVMVEIPKIYYKISTDDHYNYIQISNQTFEGACCLAHVYKGQELSKIYIDAYLSCATDYETYGPYSVSGIIPVPGAFNISYGSVYSAIKDFRGNRCEPFTYNAFTLIGCLFAIMFKSTDAKASLGIGLYSYTTNNVQTGILDTKGFCYGENTNASGNPTLGRIKLFGLEDFYGGKYTYCSGLYLASTLDRYKVIDPYDPNQEYSLAGLENFSELIPTADKLPLTNTGQKVPVKLSGINALGFARINYELDPSSVASYTKYGFGGVTTYPVVTANKDCKVGIISSSFNGVVGLYSFLTYHTGSIARRASRIIYFPEEN